MKRTLIIIAIIHCSILAFSQSNISIKEVQMCHWSEYDQTYSNCSDWVYDNSLFTINKAETMIVHKTSTRTSTYYVNRKWRDGDYFFYTVTSDVGNSYTQIFDFVHNLVKIV